MQKALFVGPYDKRDDMMKLLQKEGVVEIAEYKGDAIDKEDISVDTSKADAIFQALKILKKHDADFEHTEIHHKILEHDPSVLVEEIVALEKELSTLEEESQDLDYKMSSLNPWGEFDLDLVKEIEHSTKVTIQFWEVASKSFAEVEIPEGVHTLTVNTANQRDYFLTFAEADEAVQLDNAIEIRIEEDVKSVNTELVKNSRRQSEIKARLADLTVSSKLIHNYYLQELNSVNYEQALASTVRPLEGMLYAFQGWLAKKNVKKIKELSATKDAMLIEVEPDEGEKVPIKIENKGPAEMGEGLVLFYDTPSTSDWDPSLWVFLFFTLFFSMIMGDGGYGITLFLLLAIIRLKVKKPSKGLANFLNLSMVLTFCTFLYGTLFSGFFGINLPLPDLSAVLDKYELPLLKDYITFKGLEDGSGEKNAVLMRASILIGLIHISLSLLLKALRDFSMKQFLRPFSNFAWIALMWAFYFIYSESGGDLAAFTVAPNSYILLGGLGVVFLTSAGTLHPGKMIFGGLLGVYNGVQFFSDVLSYIRIFALGLSGSLIAIVFNDLAFQVMAIDVPIFIVGPLGILILVFGHLLNIGLCLMGAVIHGLRLNFLEYYRWSFDGDGRPFKPFKDLLMQK